MSKDARVLRNETHSAGIDQQLFDRIGANVGNWRGLVKELMRNVDLYARALHAWWNIIGDPAHTIQLIDDGVGFTRAGRGIFGGELGKSTAHGTGQGARGAIFDIAQKFEVWTCTTDNCAEVFHIARTKDAFYRDVRERREFAWSVFARNTVTELPGAFTHGSVFTITDLKREFPGIDQFKAHIEETIRFMRGFEVMLNGKLVRPPSLKGEKIYAVTGGSFGSIKNVDIEIVIPDEHGEELWLGHSTPLVTLRHFLSDLRRENVSLWRLIDPVFLRSDVRLAGFMRLDISEFQNQDQRSIHYSFYKSPLCREFVLSLLNEVLAPKIIGAYEDYRVNHGGVELTRSLGRVAVMLNRASGWSPDTAGDGRRNPGGRGGYEPPPEAELLSIAPQRLRLGLEDDGELRVVRPKSDYEYEWSDGGAGILQARTGAMVTVKTPDAKGRFLVEVRVAGRPDLKPACAEVRAEAPLTVDLTVYRQKPFRITIAQQLVIGQRDACRIRVCQAGPTCGLYDWKVEGDLVLVKKESDMGVMVGHKGKPCIGKVICSDHNEPQKYVETCEISVIDSKELEAEDKEPIVGEPSMFGQTLVDIGGHVYKLVASSSDTELWTFNLAELTVFVAGDHPALQGVSEGEYDRTVLVCLACAHLEHLVMRGEITDEETRRLKQRTVLGQVLSIASASLNK